MSEESERAQLQAISTARGRQLAEPVLTRERVEGFMAANILVAGERFAIDIEGIHGVAAMSRLTPLPHASPQIAGLIVYEGEILPAFYLHEVLALPLAALPEYGRVLLLGTEGIEFALVIQTIQGMTRIVGERLLPVPETLPSQQRALLRGLRDDGTLVLDSAALLASPLLFIDIDVSDVSTDRSPPAPIRQTPPHPENGET